MKTPSTNEARRLLQESIRELPRLGRVLLAEDLKNDGDADLGELSEILGIHELFATAMERFRSRGAVLESLAEHGIRGTWFEVLEVAGLPSNPQPPMEEELQAMRIFAGSRPEIPVALTTTRERIRAEVQRDHGGGGSRRPRPLFMVLAVAAAVALVISGWWNRSSDEPSGEETELVVNPTEGLPSAFSVAAVETHSLDRHLAPMADRGVDVAKIPTALRGAEDGVDPDWLRDQLELIRMVELEQADAALAKSIEHLKAELFAAIVRPNVPLYVLVVEVRGKPRASSGAAYLKVPATKESADVPRLEANRTYTLPDNLTDIFEGSEGAILIPQPGFGSSVLGWTRVLVAGRSTPIDDGVLRALEAEIESVKGEPSEVEAERIEAWLEKLGFETHSVKAVKPDGDSGREREKQRRESEEEE